ncbi:MAG TPA: DUF5010 C-terminal domain-containing protein [Anaerohalosphaeraceae bacterium]|nr:DUF5010 C-terminal domain-containing protein [Anaerohalosphaeraceae bacterium]HQG06885.1 DUF5010 C-terminal domain-containing protein [Anaerohalosphaeraceae bacterium]HQI08550.1 DUF5010 C-terminal domain-containing protein [Anaerohalosphaeraceae bacterium]HQJ68848.1 DUF5010 C-terminal domain-containing protein [Anaerohalosphaeraceae bacterium]
MHRSFKGVFKRITILFLLPAALVYGADLFIAVSPEDVSSVHTNPVLLARGEGKEVRVYVEGASDTSQAGEPDLPWQSVTVLLPPNANPDSVAVRVESAEYRALEGSWQIKPVPPAATRDSQGSIVWLWPEERIIEDSRDIQIYSTDAFWPAGTRVTHVGRLHQWQLVELAVPLAQYNPVSGQLRELLKADVIVDYARDDRKHGLSKSAVDCRRGRQRIQEKVINFATAVQKYDSVQEAASAEQSEAESRSGSSDSEPIGAAAIDSKGYAIVTTSAVAANSTRLAAFAAHKQSLGWTVSVVTESQWGGGMGETAAVNLRNWLRNHYADLDILYVLLIGNPHPETGDVPMRWYNDGYETDGIWGAPTDALYSDLSAGDDWDKYWEVIVGRIPYYGTIAAVDAILQKTIDYENSQQVLWRWKALLPMVPLDAQTPSYQCGEQIRANLLIPNSIGSTRIYESEYGLAPPPEYLLSSRYPAIEWASEPYGIVAWISHGWQTGATDVISTSNVNQLSNVYPSAVYEGSCQNAWPENSGNLAYRILQNGGITTVAATRNSYYMPTQTNYTTGASIGTLAYHYSQQMIVDRQSCGMALAEAKENLNLYKANATRMVLYGDPSVVVYVDPDFTPPAPNPMEWAVEPYSCGPGMVTMTAATAVDDGGGPVEYYFQCVSGGGRSSGWQSSPMYTDTALTQLYTVYRVKARDQSDSKNETEYSPPAAVTISPYPYGGQTRTIPGRIEAEHFDAGGQGVTYFDMTAGNAGGALRTREDVDLAVVTDGKTDYDSVVHYAVDDIETGEWLVYTVHSTGGTVDFYARVASMQNNGQIILRLNGEVLGTIAVVNTGSLATWQNLKIEDITLPVLENAQLKIEFVGTGFRLNWFAFQNQLPYRGNPSTLPGRLELEDFDLGGQQIAYYDTTPQNNGYGAYRPAEGVEIMPFFDSGVAGFAVLMEAGEWQEYTCTIKPGFYTIRVRHSSSQPVQQLTLADEYQDLITILLPATAGWLKWQDTIVSNIYLTGGKDRILRLRQDSSWTLLDYVDFIRQYNIADLNQSGQVNLEDFAILSSQWGKRNAFLSADVVPAGGDGVVNMLDLLAAAENWLIQQ